MGVSKKRRQYRAFLDGAQWLICLLFCYIACRRRDIPLFGDKSTRSVQ